MPYKIIGRTTNFSGKPLWEILGNLKNFGIGRIVVRHTFERYPEPSFMKIVKVETLPEVLKSADSLPTEEVRKIKVWVEKTFRGKKSDRIEEILSVSYKADYRLLPKAEEEAYCSKEEAKIEEKIFPSTIPFPPILRELLLREMKTKGSKITEPKLPLVLGKARNNLARIAKDGETPNAVFEVGLGTPKSPSLYQNVVK